MGYAITWCAVPEEAAEKAIANFGLAVTGKSEEDPESHFSMARLTTGWRLIWSNTYACPILTKGVSTFSGEHDAVLCQVEEHVMASSAELWRNGSRLWWISHEGEDGSKGLDTAGALPQCFASIKEAMERAQRAEGGDDAEVDYLSEIPLMVARDLVGFKHDEDYERVVDGNFRVLSSGKIEKGFLSRLFGK